MILYYFRIFIDYAALYDIVHYIEWHFVALCGIASPRMTIFCTTLSHITANETTPLYMILYDSLWGCMTTMWYSTTHDDIEWLYMSLYDTSWWLYIIIYDVIGYHMTRYDMSMMIWYAKSVQVYNLCHSWGHVTEPSNSEVPVRLSWHLYRHMSTCVYRRVYKAWR